MHGGIPAENDEAEDGDIQVRSDGHGLIRQGLLSEQHADSFIEQVILLFLIHFDIIWNISFAFMLNRWIF